MRLEKIKLKNFRAYHGEHTIDTKNLNVLVGKNDVGKSTILEALDIFFNGKDANTKIERADINKNAVGVDEEVVVTACFSNYPNEIDLDAGNKTNLKNECLLNREGHLEIVKKYKGTMMRPETFIRADHPTNPIGRDLLLQKNADLKTILEINEIECDDKRVNAHMRQAIWARCQDDLQKDEIEIPIDKEDAKKIWEKLDPHLPTYALFQSDRTNNDSDTEVQDPLKSMVKEVLKNEVLQKQLDEVAREVLTQAGDITKATLKKLEEMDPQIAKTLQPVIPETKDLKWADIFKNITIGSDDNVPLNKRGSGVKRLVLLNFFRASAERRQKIGDTQNIIYAIEEPETSQHLEYQRILIDALKNLSSNNAQVFLTTHSTQIVKLLFSEANQLDIGTKISRVEHDASTARIDGNSYQNCLPYVSANEINYSAFGVYEEEYHNELYGYLESEKRDIFNSRINQNRGSGQAGFKEYYNAALQRTEYVTNTKYIRHQIHHPDNTRNERYRAEELRVSIEFMRGLIGANESS